jgi:AcrR family transcriptional regulator
MKPIQACKLCREGKDGASLEYFSGEGPSSMLYFVQYQSHASVPLHIFIKKIKNKKTIFVLKVFGLPLPQIFNKEMVKERIIEASQELFSRSGLKSTTMDDIAKSMGISKRTIYENFKDKEAILAACVKMHFVENKQFVVETFQQADNVIAATLRLLHHGAELARQQRYHLIEEIKKYYPVVYKELMMCRRDEKLADMEKLVLQGIEEGLFREDLNSEIVSVVFYRQVEGITMSDQQLDRFSMLEVFENMVLIYLRGLCTQKGSELIDKLTIKFKSNQ